MVLTDDPNESLHDIIIASKGGERIPQRGEPDPDDPGGSSRVQIVDANQEQGQPTLWRIDVSYGQTTPQQIPPDNPQRAEVIWRWSVRTTTEELKKSWEAGSQTIPVVNSAGEFFKDAPKVVKGFPVLRITRNEATPYEIDQIRTYTHTINKDDYGLYGIKQSFMNSINVEGSTSFSGIGFVRVNYEIWFKFPSWDLEVLDAGLHYRVDDGPGGRPGLVPFTDQEGKPFSDEQLLRDGKPLSVEDPPVFLEFQPYKAVNWSPLGLTT